MRVWLITVGEPLPTDSGDHRLLRTGYLAQFLGSHGHEVVWWTSNFNHAQKRRRYPHDACVCCWPNVVIKLLDAPGYSHNVSVARMLNHAIVARRFAAEAPLSPKPDVILCALPTIELSEAAINYGRRLGVPVVLDVRDLWPDIIVDIFPRSLQLIARAALGYQFAKTRHAFQNASGLLAVSDSYLHWGLAYAGRSKGSRDAVIPIGYQRSTVDENEVARAEATLRSLGVDPKRRVCWFIGSFGRTYDLGTIIEAARQLELDGVRDVQFVFSGSGDRKDAWTKQAAGLTNVIFTGWVDKPQIAFLSRISTIALQAYAKGAPQGLANKLFEYLSAGLPILSSLRGENEQILAEFGCGLTYAAGDPVDFFRKLNLLLNDRDMTERMKIAALELFDSKFRMEVICKRTEGYLRALCGDVSNPGS